VLSTLELALHAAKSNDPSATATNEDERLIDLLKMLTRRMRHMRASYLDRFVETHATLNQTARALGAT